MSDSSRYMKEMYTVLADSFLLFFMKGYSDKDLNTMWHKITGELFKRGYYPEWDSNVGEFYLVKEGE